MRLFEQTGNPAVPDQQIVAAQQITVDVGSRAGLDADEVIFRLAVLALRRQPLTAARGSIAATIAAVWARIGRGSAAFALAVGISDPLERAGALVAVAAAMIEADQAEA